MKEHLIVIRARFLLKLKTYIRYPLNIIFSFVDPLIWITPIYFMSKAFEHNGELTGFSVYSGNSDFMGFLIIGYVMSTYVSTALWQTGLTIKQEMMNGTLESNWSTPTNRMTFLIGSTIFQFFIATIESIVTMIVCHFAFNFNISGNFIKAILFLLPCIITLIGLGIGVAGLILLAKEANAIIDISNALLMGFSGSSFPIKVLPKAIMMVCFIIPVTYMNDVMRNLMINQITLIPVKYEVLIVFLSMLVFYFGGKTLFIHIERKCRINGGLSGH